MVESVSEQALAAEAVTTRSGSVFRRSLRRLVHEKVGMAAITVIIAVVIAAVIAPLVAPYGPYKLDVKNSLEPPSARHILGTDEMGRDVFSRILYGARYSLQGALMVVVIAVTIGTILGTAAGWFGGLTDEILMRVTDIFLAFPSLILAMAFAAALGPSTTNASIALGVAWWPSYARLVRGQVLATRDILYIDAARNYGASDLRILLRHVLPNCMDPVIVRMSMTGGYAILMLAGLSFIGLGAQSPTPEWGLMIANARNYLYSAPWYASLIGLAIFVTVMSATLATDAIQDAFEPGLAGMVE